MPNKIKTPCCYPRCPALTRHRFCDKHKKDYQKQEDERRGNAHDRGYTSQWSRYSKWFLKQPDNVFCKLQFAGCKNIAECVDHIEPVDKNDPLFIDPANHQGACISCNSKKGRRKMIGEAKPFGGVG